MNNPKDVTKSSVLMSPEQILAMTETNSSVQHEETTEEQQGKTEKKKSIKKKKATKPGPVGSKRIELSPKKYDDSAQQASSSKGKKLGDEPGVKNSVNKKVLKAKDSVKSKAENNVKGEDAASSSMERRYLGAMEVAYEEEQVSGPSVLESPVSADGSAPKRSSSKHGTFVSSSRKDVSAKKDQASSRQSELSRNASNKSASSALPHTDFPVENTCTPGAARESAPGAIIVKGINATHQDGMDLEEGGSRMMDAVEAAEESEPSPVEAQDGTVTATAIARDDLEQEMRERFFAEAVEAEVIKLGSSPAHTNRTKWMVLLGCILLLLIIVGVVVGVVVATGDSGGGNEPADVATGDSEGDNGPADVATGNSGGGNGPAILDYLISQSSDKGVALSDPESPQHKAFLWLLWETQENEEGEPTSSLDEDKILSRYAMATLYYSTGGEEWTHFDNWLSTSHISTWYPLSESGDFDANRNILKLELRDNNLVGTLPEELVFLSSLQVIDLRRNALTGRIPSEFARLVSLKKLILRNNNLTNNYPLPPSFQSLSNLGKGRSACISNRRVVVSLSYQLTRIFSFPDTLNLYGNRLTGSIKRYIETWPSSSLGERTVAHS
jgi:hypothetical protein